MKLNDVSYLQYLCPTMEKNNNRATPKKKFEFPSIGHLPQLDSAYKASVFVKLGKHLLQDYSLSNVDTKLYFHSINNSQQAICLYEV